MIFIYFIEQIFLWDYLAEWYSFIFQKARQFFFFFFFALLEWSARQLWFEVLSCSALSRDLKLSALQVNIIIDPTQKLMGKNRR